MGACYAGNGGSGELEALGKGRFPLAPCEKRLAPTESRIVQREAKSGRLAAFTRTVVRMQSMWRGVLARYRFKQQLYRDALNQLDLADETEHRVHRESQRTARDAFRNLLLTMKRDLLRPAGQDPVVLPKLVRPKFGPAHAHSDFVPKKANLEWHRALDKAQPGAVGASTASSRMAMRKSSTCVGTARVRALRTASPLPSADGDVKASSPRQRDPNATQETSARLSSESLPLVRQGSTPGAGLPAGAPVTSDFCTAMLDRFRAGERLDVATATRLILDAERIFRREPTLLRVNVPHGSRLTVVGDLHGQLDDLVHIFVLNGLPSATNMYLFNGDFVDRGTHSCEVVFTIFAYKILYPNHVFLNRGNHEMADMNMSGGFFKECSLKYSAEVWDRFNVAFAWLPLCAVVNRDAFVVHGGLCHRDVTLDVLSSIRRGAVVCPEDNQSLLEDLLWSDPGGFSRRTGAAFRGRAVNEARGYAGCIYGVDVVRKFLRQEGLLFMIRSHECKPEGFEWHWGSRECLTIFSASRYMGRGDNKGAVVVLSPTKGNFRTPYGLGRALASPRADGIVKLRLSFGIAYAHATRVAPVLEPRTISYMAKPRARAAGFCLRYISLRNVMLAQLVRHIAKSRLKLLTHLTAMSSDRSTVTRSQLSKALCRVLRVDIPFLHFQNELGLPVLGVDGRRAGRVNIMQFLSRFAPVLRDKPISPSKRRQDAKVGVGGGKVDAGEAKASEIKDRNALLVTLFERANSHGIDLQSLFRYFDFANSGTVSEPYFRVGLRSLAKVDPELKFSDAEIDSLALGVVGSCGNVNYQRFFERVSVVDPVYARVLEMGKRRDKLVEEMMRRDSDPAYRRQLTDEIEKADQASMEKPVQI